MSTGLEHELPAPLAEALRAHGFVARTCSLISPLGTAKGRRWAYRVEDDHGRVVKVRHFEDASSADRVFALRRDLEPAFAPAIARHGAVLVEAWVEGRPLADPEVPRLVEEAGRLLGRLHARPLPPHTPARVSTHAWRAGAAADLDTLQAAMVLSAADAAALRSALVQHDPGSARTALLHMDFCAANLLVAPGGSLRVIDNEQLEFGPIGLDLGRTFHHWPMSEDAALAFWRGYRLAAPAEPAAPAFWRIVTAALGARIFLHRSPSALSASLAQLACFARGERPHAWTC